MIFRTITDDITGANKSIGLFGKSLNNIKGIINSFKQNGFVNTLLNTPLINIDTDAIDNYNNAIRAGKTYENALATARRTTNAETVALIESSHGAEVQIERVTAVQKASTIAARAHSVALKAVSIAGNMILFATISKGIQLATTAIDNWIHRVEKANEAMNEAISEYESAKSSLESINSELAEQNKKMDELLAKDKLTYAEKGQLEELQAITQELLLQQDIEQRRVDKASKEAANKTVDAYNKQYGKHDVSREHLKETLDYTKSTGISPIAENENDIVGNIAAYLNVTEGLKKAQQEYETALNNGEDTEFLIEDVQDYIDAIDDYSDVLDQNISDLQEKRLALEDEYNKAVAKRDNGQDLTSYETDAISTYESIYDAIKLIYEYTNKNDWNNMEISSIFNTEGIEKTKEELISMYKSGELSSAEMLGQFPKLNQAIKDSEIIASEGSDAFKEFFNEIAAMANGTEDAVSAINSTTPTLTISDTIDQLNTQLKPAFDSLKSAYQDIFTFDNDTGEKLFSLENVGIETFEAVKSELDKLGEIDGITVDYSAFEDFVAVLSDTSSTADEVQAQFDRLATNIIYTTDCTDMSAETYDLLVKSLKNLGVTNAEEILSNLKDIQEELVSAGYNLSDVTAEEAAKLVELGMVSAETVEYLNQYLIQKELSQNPLDTIADIQALENLCNALGITGELYQNVIALKDAFDAKERGAVSAGLDESIKHYQDRISELANGKSDYKFSFDGTATPKTSKKSGSSKKEEDKWLEEYKKKLAELQNLLAKGRLMPSPVVIQDV